MSFIIKSRRKRAYGLNEPLRHEAHKKPVTRRDFLAQGFLTGAATIVAPTMLASLLKSGRAGAAPTTTLTPDILSLKEDVCNITGGAGKIPFICFDLAGGASIAGSNVLVGTRDQLDTLSVQGYSKLGLPGGMVPDASTGTFVDTQFGLAFHTDSAFLRGMLSMTSETTRANCNGAIIPARSENDTGNNPHNPMYGIAKTGAKGELLTLIGSVASESGGNSVAPIAMVDPTIRPTKVDRASDVTGLVDTGELGTLFPNAADAVAVMESMAVLTHRKHGQVQTLLASDAEIKRFNKCGYVKSAYLAERFNNPASLNPALDTDIVGPNGIWTQAEYNGDGEFRKTAAVMKMVIDGNAGAGTIQMGGFDYHTGERATGELRDIRAGECIGACLEYAARKGRPLMIYVFSDGSLSSNGMIDNSVNGRGKGVWTGDNQATAASLMLVYNPTGPVPMRQMGAGVPRRQIGWYTADGSVATNSHPGANAVNLLVEEVVLNYLALHGREGELQTVLGKHGLGNNLDSLIAFGQVSV